MTKEVGAKIVALIGTDWEEPIWLGRILGSVLEQDSEECRLLLRLCMYLELIRLELGYDDYFEQFKGYQKVTIRPKPTLFQSLLATATKFLSPYKEGHPQIDLANIDYRLLVLVLHYHKLFSLRHYSYACLPLWIVKPMASSRGAGISLLRASAELCEMEEQEWNHFKNRRKYQNKIMQQYVSDPYLLESGPLASTKFDIRQWVLLVSGDTRVTVYLYHTAYCRFASRTYTTS